MISKKKKQLFAGGIEFQLGRKIQDKLKNGIDEKEDSRYKKDRIWKADQLFHEEQNYQDTNGG